jgi:hypothetical protein
MRLRQLDGLTLIRATSGLASCCFYGGGHLLPHLQRRARRAKAPFARAMALCLPFWRDIRSHRLVRIARPLFPFGLLRIGKSRRIRHIRPPFPHPSPHVQHASAIR